MARRGRVRAAIAITATIAVAAGVTGCGSFDSKSSGEHLIRNYVNRFGKGQVTLSSVNCPSGIAQREGTAYNCKVTLRNLPNGRLVPGTITVHIVKGNKVEIQGAQDVHLR
ncbi:MAG TPA: hypothetical protein VGL51_19895 [Solirubrobacteraceae bacterium]|jgi:hypothetical protein